MGTVRTKSEAYNFLIETIEKWDNDANDTKLIALAGFAERWSNRGNSPIAKKKAIEKNIKALELMAKRSFAVGLDQTMIEAQLNSMRTDLDELVKGIEPRQPKKPKK